MSRHTRRSPGNLRMRHPQLKNDPIRCAATEAAIRQVKGVTSVKASGYTGNLVIHYRVAGAELQELLDSVQRAKERLGLHYGPQTPVVRSPRCTSRILSTGLSGTLVGSVVEKCLERAGVALFAALL